MFGSITVTVFATLVVCNGFFDDDATTSTRNRLTTVGGQTNVPVITLNSQSNIPTTSTRAEKIDSKHVSIIENNPHFENLTKFIHEEFEKLFSQKMLAFKKKLNNTYRLFELDLEKLSNKFDNETMILKDQFTNMTETCKAATAELADVKKDVDNLNYEYFGYSLALKYEVEMLRKDVNDSFDLIWAENKTILNIYSKQELMTTELDFLRQQFDVLNNSSLYLVQEKLNKLTNNSRSLNKSHISLHEDLTDLKQKYKNDSEKISENNRLVENKFNVLTTIIHSLNMSFDSFQTELYEHVEISKNESRKQKKTDGILLSEIMKLKGEFNILSDNTTSLNKYRIAAEQNKAVIDAKRSQMETDIVVLQKCLNSVPTLSNDTKHLEKVIQDNNYKLASMKSEINARSQDFLALLDMIQKTDRKLEYTTLRLTEQQNITYSNLEQNISQCFEQVNKMDQHLENKMKTIEKAQNVAAYKALLEEVHNISEKARETDNDVDKRILRLQSNQSNITQQLEQTAQKAVVTACSINANVSHGQAIPFKKIRTAHGINNTKSLEKSGIFTAEKAGLYLITVFIQTNTTRYSFNILKNNYTIADAFSSMPGYYQTTSTSIIERLEVNDIISLSPRHFHMYVFGGEESCLSILQV